MPSEAMRPGLSSSRASPLLLRRRFGSASTASPGLAPRCTCAPSFPVSVYSDLSDSIEVEGQLRWRHYGVQRVTGDGRCIFRALAKGMAKSRGIPLSAMEEVQDADDLRLAVKEVLCDNQTEHQKYEEAIIAITVDESLKRYCQRIRRPDFWGGESELLVLSRLCRQPIIIYIPDHEYRGRGNGFIPIAEYRLEFTKNSKERKKRVPIRLLYSGRNHYDLLI